MKCLLLIACSICICILGNGCVAASPPSDVPSAPPWKCEIRLSAWCIAEGAYEITRELASDSVNDRVWVLRGRFRPESKLIILEPNGCKSGFSDVLELSGFERGIDWKGRSWDRLQVRLKSNGSCDLTILLPPYAADSMEWAFTEGIALVRPCRDDFCVGVSVAELRPKFEAQFKEQPDKNS